jgi:hypothetical protein
LEREHSLLNNYFFHSRNLKSDKRNLHESENFLSMHLLIYQRTNASSLLSSRQSFRDNLEKERKSRKWSCNSDVPSLNNRLVKNPSTMTYGLTTQLLKNSPISPILPRFSRFMNELSAIRHQQRRINVYGRGTFTYI